MLSLLSAQELADICGGLWHPAPPSGNARGIKIDSRALDKGNIFVALKGARSDGHDFVSQLDVTDIFAAIVEHAVANTEVAQLVVPDALIALQTLAQNCALRTTATKLAITGSVGKTGTKEMLAHLLATAGQTHATRGNLNNHIGMPLTLVGTPQETNYLVVEMGMNHAGEIAALTEMMLPHIAAITCISDTHSAHFSNLSDIAEAKTEIFNGLSGAAVAILPRDDAFYGQLAGAAQLAGARSILTFGYHKDSDFRVVSCHPTSSGLSLEVEIPDASEGRKILSFALGMNAVHWAISAACVLAMASAAGVDVDASAPHLTSFQDLPGRGLSIGLNVAGHHFTLIDDSYNASPSSMTAAITHLATQSGDIKSAILSDMLELGDGGHDAHIALVTPLMQAGISRLITVGEMMAEVGERLAPHIEVKSFQTADDVISQIISAPEQIIGNSTIMLVKGSHGSGAHLIATQLMAFGVLPSSSISSSDEGVTPDAA
ncbi:MAG: UDP-N-acetylmuramoyl-tripeptide--D-alanyl-D-alanine ligase [Alphaproteobacteria bacterium]|nr:UDP-N-acetylmuramoyl-tripeptide--D-alanyl-D-alanine ligase [Alphaproteobacteria bacterium]